MVFRFDAFALDTGTRQLVRDGAPVHLSPKAFELLTALVENRPWAVSKTDLHARVWPGTFVTDASLATLVNEIRAALGDNPRQPRFVRTVHGFGYAFCGQASAASTPAPTACWIRWQERDIALPQGEHLLGRAPDAAIRVDRPEISRRHARITVAPAGATLEDLGSRNGTFLRGERLTAPAPLRDGDDIRLGPVGLTFHVACADGTTKAASSAMGEP